MAGTEFGRSRQGGSAERSERSSNDFSGIPERSCGCLCQRNYQAYCARTILTYFESFEFVFKTHLLMKVLEWTFTLSRSLQMRDRFMVNGIHLIDMTKDCLDQKLVDHGWETLLKDVTSFCAMTSKSVIWMIFTSQF